MRKEDIEFLKELQEELRTQDNCCQAEPVYWGVMTDGVIPCQGDDDWDSVRIRKRDDILDFDDFLTDVRNGISGGLEEEFKKVRKDDPEEVADFADGFLGWDVEPVYYKTERVISKETGCFLTKRACEEHIRRFGYHYDNPRPYAMTAWRNPEFGRFMRIFTKMDLNQIPVDAGDGEK